MPRGLTLHPTQPLFTRGSGPSSGIEMLVHCSQLSDEATAAKDPCPACASRWMSWRRLQERARSAPTGHSGLPAQPGKGGFFPGRVQAEAAGVAPLWPAPPTAGDGSGPGSLWGWCPCRSAQKCHPQTSWLCQPLSMCVLLSNPLAAFLQGNNQT